MNCDLSYLGAPAEGEAWTIEDVWNLAPGENPPWNPQGIRLNPSDFPDRASFEAEKNRLIDESGYRALYEEYKKGRPGSYQRFTYETGKNKKLIRNLLIGAAAVTAAIFAFGS